jgi:hypothetical protein
MRVVHNARTIHRHNIAVTPNRPPYARRRDPVTVPPFAARSAAFPPYAGNGLLRNLEPFTP